MSETATDVKKSLGYVWGKESDLSETYEFEFPSETSWLCIRKNREGERKFRLQFDRATSRLWWGESYFLEPADLISKPERAAWYRASDSGNAKKKPSFVWHRLRTATKAVSSTSKPPVTVLSKGSGKGLQAFAPAKPADSAPSGASVRNVQEEHLASASKNSRHSISFSGGAAVKVQQPEVILDLMHMLVIYKPPYWKCELPAKDEEKRNIKDSIILLRWIKDHVPNIDTKLFEEEFNPALSGTGFGPLSHRIDQETSGPLLVAKTAAAQKHIKSQFHKTTVSKRYCCLVHGHMAKNIGTVEAPIRTLRTGSTTRSEISSSGDWAQTNYQVIATFQKGSEGKFSLVGCDIKSGRTHQIRVHMQSLGHPLVSDDKYLPPDESMKDRGWCPRLFLHCFRLRFRDLRNEDVLVICPLPDDLKGALALLGAADPRGHSTEIVFGETSWQWEVFRPPLRNWRPGSQVQRRVLKLIEESERPLLLKELNADTELRSLMDAEGMSCISKSWLSKYWNVFDVIPDSENQLALRLRPGNAIVDDGSEVNLERQIEAVRSELEDLQRQKQRCVALEQFGQAAEIKRRVEAAAAELASLSALLDEHPSEPDRLGEEASAEGPGSLRASQPRRLRKDVERREADAFLQDVGDEAAFPSLGASSAPKQMPTSSAETGTGRDGQEAEAVSLKDALTAFLERREGSRAHMNEVNNDRFLQQVMAAQKPKPITAVTKAWLKEHNNVFALLRTADNQLYVAMLEVVNATVQKSASKNANENQQKTPAYQMVVQKTSVNAPALVYQYSAAARAEDGKKAKAADDIAGGWQKTFLDVLEQAPLRSCSAEELLSAVPIFASATGAKKISEQKELLVMFLEASPNVFRVEKRGSGSTRQYTVWAK